MRRESSLKNDYKTNRDRRKGPKMACSDVRLPIAIEAHGGIAAMKKEQLDDDKVASGSSNVEQRESRLCMHSVGIGSKAKQLVALKQIKCYHGRKQLLLHKCHRDKRTDRNGEST